MYAVLCVMNISDTFLFLKLPAGPHIFLQLMQIVVVIVAVVNVAVGKPSFRL